MAGPAPARSEKRNLGAVRAHRDSCTVDMLGARAGLSALWALQSFAPAVVAQTLECPAGSIPQPAPCFAEVNITISIVEDGYGGQIYWNLDGGAYQAYTGGADLTGHNGWEYSHIMPLDGSPESPHTFAFVDTHGDGWHGGWWQVADGCGRLLGGGPVDGQVNSTGGEFEFTGDNATHGVCTGCPAGQLTVSAGLTECSICPEGRYSTDI
eukprot:SAG22_NODE_7895_length_699_cov_1.540000_1_plen_209_part_10